MAPVGLITDFSAEKAFRVAAEAAAITHSHPSGYLPAGTLAAMLVFIREGSNLEEAVEHSMRILEKWEGHQETTTALENAVTLADSLTKGPDPGASGSRNSFQDTEKLGGGWTGEEALTIAVFCSLCFPDDFEKAVILAVNHGGDSDSTGAITGNILGLLLGEKAIPARWLANLELKELISRMANDLYAMDKIL